MKEFIPEDTFEETDNKNELRNLLFNYFIYWKWFILSGRPLHGRCMVLFALCHSGIQCQRHRHDKRRQERQSCQ